MTAQALRAAATGEQPNPVAQFRSFMEKQKGQLAGLEQELEIAQANKLAGKNPLAVVKPCKRHISARHGHIAEYKEEDDGGQAHQ